MRTIAPRPLPAGQPRKILVILLDHLGDTAQGLPLLLALARDCPLDSLTIVTTSTCAPLFAPWPAWRVLTAPAATTKWQRWFKLPGQRYRFARQRLQAEGFDVAIVARWDTDFQCAVLLSYFSGAPCRVSFSEKVTRDKARHNARYDRLLTTAMQGASGREPERIVQLVSEVAPASRTPGLERVPRPASARIRRLLPADRRWVALCPSSGSSPLKQWGLDRWTTVAAALAQRGLSVVLVGSQQDAAAAREIQHQMGTGCVDLTGAISLAELMAVLGVCELFLGNDCGPVHVASAVNCPTLAVMGSTCDHRFGGWADRSVSLRRDLPCSPCRTHRRDRCADCIYDRQRCLEEISPEEVLTIAIQMLNRGMVP